MTQHASLRMDSVGVKHRNVLKRYERIKKMQAENRWEDRKTVYNLPKLKSIKIKVKKVKEVPAEAAGTAPGTEAAAPAAAAPAAKSAKPAK